MPECISQLNTPVTAFCYNWTAGSLLGDMGIATFSVLSFIYSLANAVLSGISQGLQPLWGQSFGRKDDRTLKDLFHTGLKISIFCSAVICVLLIVFRVPVVTLFNGDPELVKMASEALPVFSLSFLFMAVNLIFTAYFYSTKQTLKSDVIALSRGIVLKSLAIFLIPTLLGSGFLWYPPVVAEILTLLLCVFCSGSCPEFHRTSRTAPENRASAKKDYSAPPSGSGRMTEISSVYPPDVSYSCFRKFPSRSNCVRRAIFTSSTASASHSFPASFRDNSMRRK